MEKEIKKLRSELNALSDIIKNLSFRLMELEKKFQQEKEGKEDLENHSPIVEIKTPEFEELKTNDGIVKDEQDFVLTPKWDKTEEYEKIYPKTKPKKSNPPNEIILWLSSVNPLLKIGVLILFLGLGFLLRYIGSVIPMSIRYALVFGAGIAASIGGEILLKKRRDYGLTLQGFGFAVMYLTALAAVKLHSILSENMAFILMVIAVALMAWQSVKKDAKLMAQIAVLGGLAAPILVSSGSGSHIVLFSYLAILNTGIAIIAWFKAWRSLNIIGATGTFFIAILWSYHYKSSLFISCEFFLLYHFLLYSLISCFFAHRSLLNNPLSGDLSLIPNNASLKRIWDSIVAYGMHISGLDSSLLFGTALSSFGLQYAMVNQWDNASAYSALLWSAIYGIFAFYYTKLNTNFSVLKQAFTLLAALFFTLSIPLGLEEKWTSSAWALEAALVYIFAILQKQSHIRLFSLIVFALSAFLQFKNIGITHYSEKTLLYGSSIGAFLLMIGGVVIYYYWDKYQKNESAEWERNSIKASLFIGLFNSLTLPLLILPALYCIPILSIISLFFSFMQGKKEENLFSFFTLLAILTAILCTFRDNSNNLLIVFSALLWIVSAYLLYYKNNNKIKTITSFEIINLWLGLSFSIIYFNHFLNQNFAIKYNLSIFLSANIIWLVLLLFSHYKKWKNALSCSALLALLIAFFIWQIAIPLWKEENNLFLGAMILLFSTILAIFNLLKLPENKVNYFWHSSISLSYIFLWTFLFHYGENSFGFIRPLETLIIPFSAWLIFTYYNLYFSPYHKLYLNNISFILAIYCIFWLLAVNFNKPLASSYIPIINTIELGSIAIIYQFWNWQKKAELKGEIAKLILPALTLISLVLLSAAVMRFWHYHKGINWDLHSLFASFAIQTSLSIIWATTAIIAMVLANRRNQRKLWFVGVSLMAIVVFKLFLVELANSNGIERIISFIAVGLLLLFVGWVAPVPTKEEKK